MIQRDRTNDESRDAAKAEQSASLHNTRLGGIDYRELRSLVSMADVLRILDWKPVERHGDQLRGPCFVHGSSSEASRSLSINLTKNAYRCFAACCGSHGNHLDLFAAAIRQPIYQAAFELCEVLGITPPSLPAKEDSARRAPVSRAEMEAGFLEHVRRMSCQSRGDSDLFSANESS